MICLNIAIRTAAVESCAASRLAARSSGRKFSSHSRSPIQLSPRILSTLQTPLSSQPRSRTALSVVPSRIADRRRTYGADTSQNANTMHGTIGKGASGVGEESQRVKERLQAPDHLNEKEKMIFEKLDGALEPTKLEVQDISGGCGSMYGIEIVSERFRGLSMLKQQRLVNEVLGEEIKGWHGVQLKTRIP